MARGRRVLIIVQNLPVPLDRRVWLECRALVAAGYGVSVICPKGPGDPGFQVIDEVRIHKYSPPPAAVGALGYVREFVYCWIRTALISLRVLVREGFDAVQACNPPDTYFVLGGFYRLLGKRFVYDQHDLNPEVFLSRFGAPRSPVARLQFWLLTALERGTYRTADHVISTNDSYRRTAINRGHVAPEQVTVVRSGPDTSRMRPVDADVTLRAGRPHLAVYLGIMGPQDGVDLLLRAWAHLVGPLGRTDCHLALLGFGDCLEDLRRQADDLGLADQVTFTGRVGPAEITRYLSTADLGVCPDPASPLNDVSTMNKVMEYMAYALPLVTFDLGETRVSAGDTAVYVPSPDVEAFARAVDRLLSDDDARAELAVSARRRVSSQLDWQAQRDRYVGVYEKLLRAPARRAPTWPAVDRRRVRSDTGPERTRADQIHDQWGNRLVDLRDESVLRRFVRTRRLDAHDEQVTAPTTGEGAGHDGDVTE